MKKKVLSFALCVCAIAALLSGCGGGNAEQASTAPESSYPLASAAVEQSPSQSATTGKFTSTATNKTPSEMTDLIFKNAAELAPSSLSDVISKSKSSIEKVDLEDGRSMYIQFGSNRIYYTLESSGAYVKMIDAALNKEDSATVYYIAAVIAALGDIDQETATSATNKLIELDGTEKSGETQITEPVGAFLLSIENYYSLCACDIEAFQSDSYFVENNNDVPITLFITFGA